MPREAKAKKQVRLNRHLAIKAWKKAKRDKKRTARKVKNKEAGQ